MTDIQSIIAQMTLEEKAALCTGATAWSTTPIERLGVPEMYVTDGPHGVRRAAEADAFISQSLPGDVLSHCFLSGRQRGMSICCTGWVRHWAKSASL